MAYVLAQLPLAKGLIGDRVYDNLSLVLFSVYS